MNIRISFDGLFIFRQEYLENHLAPYLHTDQHVLIMYDGHTSHVTDQLIRWAKEKKIILFVLPPHTSHVLQPLDVAVFGSFKSCYYSLCQDFMRKHIGSKITRYNICEIACRAYAKSNTPANITSAFRKTGIYPFNPTVITPSLLAPSVVQSRSAHTAATIINDITSYLAEKVPTAEEAPSRKPTKRKQTSYGGCAITETVQVPVADEADLPEASGTFQAVAVAEEVPAPTEETPVHAEPGPSGIQSRQTVQKALIYDAGNDASVDDSEDEVCCVCQKQSPPGLKKVSHIRFVDWAQCSKCLHWTHLEFCTPVVSVGRDEVFYCPHCHQRKSTYRRD